MWAALVSRVARVTPMRGTEVMMKLKLALVAGALVSLPGMAFAQTGAGTGGGTGGGTGASGALGALSTFKATVLKLRDGTMNDLARVRDGRLRKTDQELTNEMSTVKF